MLNIAIGKKSIIVAIAFFIFLSLFGSAVSAQTYQHKVVKGDTLWSICELYYGDAFLWPKLWQMNPFITNPHLLEPGDIINLLEDMPITTDAKPLIKPSDLIISGTTSEEIVEVAPPPEIKPTAKSRDLAKAIDLSGYTDFKALGYLTYIPVKPWGRIDYKTNDKVILSENEPVLVFFFQTEGLKKNQEFTAYRTVPCKHPVTNKTIGKTVEVTGKLTLQKPLQNGYYLMAVNKLLRTIDRVDYVMPLEPVSPCVLPLSSNTEIVANIIAVKDQLQIIGERSVVYIDKGFNHGIQRGQCFNIVQNTANMVELSLGKLIIVEVRPDTSVGLVLRMEARESGVGMIIKSISWKETPEWLAKLPGCKTN